MNDNTSFEIVALGIVIAYQLFVGELGWGRWKIVKVRREEDPEIYWVIVASECVLLLGLSGMSHAPWVPILKDMVQHYSRWW